MRFIFLVMVAQAVTSVDIELLLSRYEPGYLRYFECSAKTNAGVTEMMTAVVRELLMDRARVTQKEEQAAKQAESSTCMLL